MKMRTRVCFSRFHPLFLLLYYIAVISVSVFSSDPIILSISLLGAVLFCINLFGKGLLKDAVFLSVLTVLLTVTNPLFSQNGITVLFYLGDRAYTLEALLYGLNMSVMVSAVILWFKSLNAVLTDDKMQYLFSKSLPKTTLVITMVMRFIPLYIKTVKDINDTRRAMGLYPEKNIFKKIRNACEVFLTLVTQSLENAVETSFSMKARGYGEGERTSYSIYKIKPTDITLISLLAISLTGFIYAFGVRENSSFAFYPTFFVPEMSDLRISMYFVFALVSLFPFLINSAESIKWKYYLSKI